MQSFELYCEPDVLRKVLIEFHFQNDQIVVDSLYRFELGIKNINRMKPGAKLLVKGNADVPVMAYVRFTDVIDNDLGPKQIMLQFVVQFHAERFPRLMKHLVVSIQNLIIHASR
ncbi:hypothetical protein D3C78_1277980 [compost metagenome]